MRPLSLGGLRNASAGVIAASLFLLPNFVAAYPFGGSIMQIIFCYNKAIYAAVGPPNGGPFIWTPSTKTYPFGPPQHVGQWLLGLVAPPYYCIVSKQPVIVWSGVLMTMEGSSGAAAPAGGIPVSYPSGGPGGGTPPGGGPGTPGGPSNSIGHVVISEVYPYPDLSHGNTSQYAWIELYNGSSAAVDLSHFILRTTQTSQTIANGTMLAPGAYAVFSATTTIRSLWTIPASSTVVAFSSSFAGFKLAQDHVSLENSAGVQIDAISWGTDTSIFSLPAPIKGHALIRKTLATDSDTAADWIDTSAPTPGR